MYNIVIIAIIVVIVAIVFLFVSVGFYLRYFDHAYPIDPELNELANAQGEGDSSAPWRKVRTEVKLKFMGFRAGTIDRGEIRRGFFDHIRGRRPLIGKY